MESELPMLSSRIRLCSIYSVRSIVIPVSVNHHRQPHLLETWLVKNHTWQPSSVEYLIRLDSCLQKLLKCVLDLIDLIVNQVLNLLKGIDPLGLGNIVGAAGDDGAVVVGSATVTSENVGRA